MAAPDGADAVRIFNRDVFEIDGVTLRNLHGHHRRRRVPLHETCRSSFGEDSMRHLPIFRSCRP